MTVAVSGLAYRPTILLKKNAATSVSGEFCEIFRRAIHISSYLWKLLADTHLIFLGRMKG